MLLQILSKSSLIVEFVYLHLKQKEHRKKLIKLPVLKHYLHVHKKSTDNNTTSKDTMTNTIINILMSKKKLKKRS